MTINYPNGKKFESRAHIAVSNLSQPRVQHGKRGMRLEEEITESNQFYLERNIAVIHKKPTPIQVVKVDYPRRSAAVIKEAYYRHSSTTDFNGVYRGKYIDFEAKETQNKTSFPLNNFHEHQIIHMERCQKMGGLTFVLIRFSSLNRVFLLESTHLSLFWENQNRISARKSIPLKYIEENGYEIPHGFRPALDYLKVVDSLIESKNTRKGDIYGE